MSDQILNYSIQVKVRNEYDIVIAGGGTAGVTAAVSAARQGMKVCIIEQAAMLGGLGTSGMMTAIIAPKRYFGGIGLEIVESLKKRGGVGPDADCDTCTWVPYKNETMKMLLDDIVFESGVDLYLYTKITDIIQENNSIKGIIVSGPEGSFAISGKIFIDATGDGMLSYFAGEAFEVGDKEGKTQAPTMTAYYSNIDYAKFSEFLKKEGGDFVKLIHKYVPIAVEDGVLSTVDYHHPGCFRVGDNYAVVNAGHVYGADCITSKGLTEATVSGRKLAKEYFEFYKKYFPGFENAVMTNTASWLGIRETRRIVGKYLLTYDDKLNYRKFEDAVLRFDGGAASDLHASSNSKEDYLKYYNLFTAETKHDPDDYATLPYRSLLAKNTKNLFVAGRCLSADRITHAQLRVMGYCMMMGQVVGTAAANSIKENKFVAQVDMENLQKQLKEEGVANK